MAQKAIPNPADENLPGSEGRSSLGTAALIAVLVLLSPYLDMAILELQKNKQISDKFKRATLLKFEESRQFLNTIVANKSWPEQLDETKLNELVKKLEGLKV